MEVIPPRFRKLWKDWDLRVTVLLSLIFQIILIVLGHRRRFDSKIWIRIVAWSAYLAADSVATFSLGILSGNLTDLFDEHAKSLDANTELEAFWAPFLLLHLGGPDTITAYALEDNELCLMFVVGFIKYGERTWVLRSASKEKLRQSMFTSTSSPRSSSSSRDIDLFRDQNEIKNEEGYITRPTVMVSEVQLPVDLSVYVNSNSSISHKEKLLTAYGFLRLTKGLFLDAVLSSRDRDGSKTVFRYLSFQNAFQVIEMELGLLYDLLYTKAPLLYTLWGLALRLLTFFVTCCVLALFTFFQQSQKQKYYSKVDLSITFLLLVVAIILEIYSAVFMVIPSDQFLISFIRRNNSNVSTSTSRFALSCLPSVPKGRRWSHEMGQLRLLKFVAVEPLPFHKILKLLGIDKTLEKRWCVAHEKVPEDLKQVIFRFFNQKGTERKPWESNSKASFIMVPGAQGNNVDDDDDKSISEAAPKLEDDPGNSILFWHIITEVLHRLDGETEETREQFEAIAVHCDPIMQISRYVSYLLVVHPSMFSIGVLDLSSFEDTVHRVRNEIRRNTNPTSDVCGDLVKEECYTKFRSTDRLLYDASRTVAHLRKKYGEQAQAQGQGLAEKWNKLGCTWLKILAFAASKSKGSQHGQQLRRGGEFLTHVWLLMAHFGMTDHFQISELQLTRLYFY
ncbi:hypothetical protein CISIN_1g005801mg [Citrus sinensis]|uniref:DUF4220 domain-containing protein n=1 Tax=Citrus sinensis TaxID=2711 RepID=A0A067GCU1_CITSI|nr:hypothetical protein CISIN_1g005801mg [Citrus sinensis]